jgi:hypothetical protein
MPVSMCATEDADWRRSAAVRSMDDATWLVTSPRTGSPGRPVCAARPQRSGKLGLLLRLGLDDDKAVRETTEGRWVASMGRNLESMR